MTVWHLIGGGIGSLVGLALANWVDIRAHKRMYAELAQRYRK